MEDLAVEEIGRVNDAAGRAQPIGERVHGGTKTERGVEQDDAGRGTVLSPFLSARGSAGRTALAKVLGAMTPAARRAAMARTEGRWYALAWCRRVKGRRWFRMDRIRRAKLTREPVVERDLRDVFGEPPVDAQPVGSPERRGTRRRHSERRAATARRRRRRQGPQYGSKSCRTNTAPSSSRTRRAPPSSTVNVTSSFVSPPVSLRRIVTTPSCSAYSPGSRMSVTT